MYLTFMEGVSGASFKFEVFRTDLFMFVFSPREDKSEAGTGTTTSCYQL